MDFKNIEKKHRPIPFWSWNTRLETNETAEQVRLMDDASIGGFFMHARGGLTTEYMGDEWFDNISVAIDEANSKEMQAWVYDENGWPSGFGNGIVNSLGLHYQQKYLRYDRNITNEENLICVIGEYRFYYEINPFYVDLLDGKVTEEFIEKVYQPYYERYKNNYKGYFTDEPQLSRDGFPWSLKLPEEYEMEYGENLLDKLDELFFATGEYEETRLKFWRLVTKLFVKNYTKKIYDWCTERGLGFTGHMLLEETLETQLTCNGACMPHYEYFTMPGMDWLSRNMFDCFTPLQVTSVAAQLGKKQVLSETFALSGHNVGFDELKGIYQWQMVHGITRLCQHLEGYSLEGLRKRDCPPAMFYQQPWWKEYKIFNESMARIGKILSEGKIKYDTLLIHNQSSAWKCFDANENIGLDEYNDALLEDYKSLMEKHILFHFGDEIIMERHAKVDGNELVIGEQRYKTVVIPKNMGFFKITEKLLKEFEKNGGIIITSDKIEVNDICSSSKIMYTERIFDSFKVYYFINNTNEWIATYFKKGNKKLDIVTGEVKEFCGKYTFAPYDSLVLIDDGGSFADICDNDLKYLDLSGKWKIKNVSENVLTVDTCDVYFDDVLEGKDESAADVLYMALEKKKSLNVRLDYRVMVEDIPNEIFLVCEHPERFTIMLNGKKLEKADLGHFVDKSFRKISINDMLINGENIISMQTYFNPDAKIYEDVEKAYIFESEKNKLTFDLEFESIYLIGEFSVNTQGTFVNLEKNAVRYKGGFAIKSPQKEITLSNIEQQGFPFFSGNLIVNKKFCLNSTDYKIGFKKKGINIIKVRVNDIDCDILLWGALECDISPMLKVGENIIEIEIVNNLRNMLGPHHLAEGESYGVWPSSFYKRGNVWTNGINNEWDENYCFAEVSLENSNRLSLTNN